MRKQNKENEMTKEKEKEKGNRWKKKSKTEKKKKKREIPMWLKLVVEHDALICHSVKKLFMFDEVCFIPKKKSEFFFSKGLIYKSSFELCILFT